MRVGIVVSALVVALGAGPAAAAEPRALTIPTVRDALVRAGYPARTQCGVHPEPTPPLETHEWAGRDVPLCWIVVERARWSVHVTPFTTSALATLAVERTRNPWAKTTRQAAVGHVVVSAFRLPARAWQPLLKTVASAFVRGARR